MVICLQNERKMCDLPYARVYYSIVPSQPSPPTQPATATATTNQDSTLEKDCLQIFICIYIQRWWSLPTLWYEKQAHTKNTARKSALTITPHSFLLVP